MREAEAMAVVEQAIRYVLHMAESSGEDNGEAKLAEGLASVVFYIEEVAEHSARPCERCGAPRKS